MEQMFHNIIDLEVRVLFQHAFELCDEFLIDNYIVNFLNLDDLAPALGLPSTDSSTSNNVAQIWHVHGSKAGLAVVVNAERTGSEDRLSPSLNSLPTREGAVEAVRDKFEFSASIRNIFNIEELFASFYAKVP